MAFLKKKETQVHGLFFLNKKSLGVWVLTCCGPHQIIKRPMPYLGLYKHLRDCVLADPQLNDLIFFNSFVDFSE